MNTNLLHTDELERELARRFGLRPRQRWRGDLSSALAQLARRHRIAPEALSLALDLNPALMRELAGLLTIEETYFFRFPEQVAAAVGHLGRRWWQTAPAPLVVWSAGCSTGEEPYSVAIGIQDSFGALAKRCPVLACDVNVDALARARAAIYGSWSFRGVPRELRDRCFVAVGGNRFELLGRYREMVRFEHLSIQEMAHQLAQDSVQVVLFRNVGVYFDAPALADCYRAFDRVLNPDGLLVQAATDPTPPRDVFERVSGQPVGVYHRVGPPRHPEPKAPRRAASLPPPAPGVPRSLHPPPHVDALALADRGHLDRALRAADQVVSNDAGAAALILRGQIHLAADRPEAAADDLRRAVFVAPRSWLARYWYIVALQTSHDPSRVGAQVRELKRQLEGRADEDLLDDGVTAVGELRRALRTIGTFYE